jgi:acetyl-CoA carboxylase biotin carboxyl carrier protein
MADEPLLSAEDVTEIIAVIDGTKYDSVDIQTKRVSVKLSRSGQGWTQDWKTATSLAEPVVAVANLTVSKSAANFVEVGSHIKQDTIIGIIETMKVMSSIVSGHAGEVVEIVAENGVMVDKDGVLMRVRQA